MPAKTLGATHSLTTVLTGGGGGGAFYPCVRARQKKSRVNRQALPRKMDFSLRRVDSCTQARRIDATMEMFSKLTEL